MIEAAEIIDNFAKGGYKLSLDQGFIHCKPTPSENLIEQLKFHKPEIIAYLENKKLPPVFINLSDSGEKKQYDLLPSQGGTIGAQNSETISEHLPACSTLTTGTVLDSTDAPKLQVKSCQSEEIKSKTSNEAIDSSPGSNELLPEDMPATIEETITAGEYLINLLPSGHADRVVIRNLIDQANESEDHLYNLKSAILKVYRRYQAGGKRLKTL
jgi:hypothetical protein